MFVSLRCGYSVSGCADWRHIPQSPIAPVRPVTTEVATLTLQPCTRSRSPQVVTSASLTGQRRSFQSDGPVSSQLPTLPSAVAVASAGQHL